MSYSKRSLTVLLFVALNSMSTWGSQAVAKDAKQRKIYSVAVVSFAERGTEVRQLGGKLTDLIFGNLSANDGIMLLDREEFGKVLAEQELSLSGAVNSKEAIQVGQLTGAKLLVTGSIQQIDSSLIVTAKIIGTETTRVAGAMVRGKAKDDLATLAESLAEKISKAIADRADELVATPVSREDRLAALKKSLRGEKQLPKVFVTIRERHVGHATIDPAAETELTLLCTETGFSALDEANKKRADVLITGEGCSEFAVRHGNLISVKARVEVKAADQDSGKVIAIDRQTAVVLDLTEQLAGKAALQEAAATIAERMLPKIAQAAKPK